MRLWTQNDEASTFRLFYYRYPDTTGTPDRVPEAHSRYMTARPLYSVVSCLQTWPGICSPALLPNHSCGGAKLRQTRCS